MTHYPHHSLHLKCLLSPSLLTTNPADLLRPCPNSGTSIHRDGRALSYTLTIDTNTCLSSSIRIKLNKDNSLTNSSSLHHFSQQRHVHKASTDASWWGFNRCSSCGPFLSIKLRTHVNCNLTGARKVTFLLQNQPISSRNTASTENRLILFKLILCLKQRDL